MEVNYMPEDLIIYKTTDGYVYQGVKLLEDCDEICAKDIVILEPQFRPFSHEGIVHFVKSNIIWYQDKHEK
jgi:hypothetical protein